MEISERQTYRILSTAAAVNSRGHRFSITQTHRLHTQQTPCAPLRFFLFWLKKKKEHTTKERKPYHEVAQPRRTEEEMLSVDEMQLCGAADCLPFWGGVRKRLCNLGWLGWLAGLSTMCSLVAQWKIVGGTRRLARCPAGGLEPGGDPVCCNETQSKRWHQGSPCPPVIAMK